MHWELDRGKLPDDYTIEKAHWHYTQRVFGTLYTSPKTVCRMDMEGRHPEIVKMIADPLKVLALPRGLAPGWTMQTQWYSSEWSEAAFVALWFAVPHELTILGDSIPDEVGYLLSAYLQLGEEMTFRNFRNFEDGRGLKFLPFLITRKEFRFYVYQPNRDRVLAAIDLFRAALGVVQDLPLQGALEDAYGLVRLAELKGVVGSLPGSGVLREALEDRFKNRVGRHRKSLGLVYASLPGPQNAKGFFYEVNGKKVEHP